MEPAEQRPSQQDVERHGEEAEEEEEIDSEAHEHDEPGGEEREAGAQSEERHDHEGIPSSVPPPNAHTVLFDLGDHATLAVQVARDGAAPGYFRASWQFPAAGTAGREVEVTIGDRSTGLSKTYVLAPGAPAGGDVQALLALP